MKLLNWFKKKPKTELDFGDFAVPSPPKYPTFSKEIDKEMEAILSKPVAPQVTIPSVPIEPKELVAVDKHRGFAWREKSKLDKNPTKVYLVTMIFGNGSCQHFVGEPNVTGFVKHRKKLYHINQKLCVWDANENNNRVYFHENYVEPLEIKEVKIEGQEGASYMTYVTPDNVGAVIRMESVRLIAEGPDLQKWLRICTFVSIATLGILIIIMIVFMAQSGIFQHLSQSIQGQVQPPVGR